MRFYSVRTCQVLRSEELQVEGRVSYIHTAVHLTEFLCGKSEQICVLSTIVFIISLILLV